MALINHYLFDTATGINDSVGSANYTLGIGSISLSGKVNECLLWDASSSGYALTGGPALLSMSDRSISLWIKYTGYGQFDIFGNGYWRAEINSSGMATFLNLYYFSSFGPEVSVVLPSSAINTWQHIVIINSSTYWDFYFNGSYLGSYSSINFGTGGYSNYIGSGISGSFDVYIDDLRVYDSAIDSTEVGFVYNSGTGTQSVSGSGSSAGSAIGALDTVTVSAFAFSGSASGGGGTPGSASGSLDTITISSLSASAEAITVAYGAFPSITVFEIESIPAVIATIQLDYAACDGEITWTQTLPITGFSSAFQGQDAISSRVTPTIGASGANIVFFEQRTIAASGSYTYDLTALTDFLGGALSLSRAYAVVMVTSSGAATLSPGATNPFQWFFAASTANVTLAQGDAFMFAQPESATIDSGSKTLVVTNTSGSASLVYKIAILGGR